MFSAASFVAASLGVRRSRVRPSGIHGSGADPIRTGTSASGAQPATGYRHRPGGRGSGSRTHVSRTTTSCPDRWTIPLAGLRRGESHPVLQLMRLGCSLVHHAAMGTREAGGPQAAGAIRTHKGSFTGGVPDPFWRQRQAPASPEYPLREIRGEPRLPHIPLGHHARWCRSRRVVVGIVGLTRDSSG